jgi:hypothetical protein
MTHRAGYLREFVNFWSERPEVRKIWMSLYTPQIGEESSEILRPEVRERVIVELSALKDAFRKLELPTALLKAYRRPPLDPGRCVFALTTQTISVDLRTVVTPVNSEERPTVISAGALHQQRWRSVAGIACRSNSNRYCHNLSRALVFA